jgi:hypothetical protein
MPAAGLSLILLFFFATAPVRPAMAEPALPSTVKSAIAKVYPGGRLLSRRGLSKLCVAVPDEAGGVLRSDFDGDGNDDYAVLVNLGRSQEKGEPGETLYDIALVSFMTQKDGGFAKHELDRFEGFSLAFWLREEPEGEIRDEERRETVAIRTPGIYVDYCGGGAVHYWLGGKFHAIEIGG